MDGKFGRAITVVRGIIVVSDMKSRIVRLKITTSLIVIFLLSLIFWAVISNKSHETLLTTLILHFIAVVIGVLLIEAMFLGIETYAQSNEEDKYSANIAEKIAIILDSRNDPAKSYALKLRFKGVESILDRLEFGLLKDSVALNGKVDILNTWLPNASEVFSLIDSALVTGGHVRILLAQARSNFVDARSSTLGRDVSERIRISYAELHAYFNEIIDEDHKSRLQLRLYKCAPPFSFYGIGSYALIGFFGRTRAVDTFQLKVLADSSVGKSVESQFEEIWKQALPVDLSRQPQNWGF